MNTEVMQAVAEAERLGIQFRLRGGDRVTVVLPPERDARVEHVLARLRKQRALVAELLRKQSQPRCYVHGESAHFWTRPDGGEVCGLCHPSPDESAAERDATVPPPLPAGVRLIQWQPKNPPIIITSYSVVTDVQKFVRRTVEQLGAALRGDEWGAGHRSVRDLVEVLEQCGVQVQLSGG